MTDDIVSRLPEKVWLSFSDEGTYLEDWSPTPFATEYTDVAAYVRVGLDVSAALAERDERIRELEAAIRVTIKPSVVKHSLSLPEDECDE